MTLSRPLIAITLLGLVTSVTQVTLLREALAASSGNELALALGLCIWLLGSAAGAAAGGCVPARWTKGALTAAGILLLLAPAAALLLARGILAVFHIAPGELLTLRQQLEANLLVMAPVSLLAGATFVLACRLPALPPRRVYLAEAVGWLGGGALATWALVTVPSFSTVVLLAGVTLAALTLLWEHRWLWLLGLGAGLAAAPCCIALDTRTLGWYWPEQQIRAVSYTQHGQGVVLERAGQQALYEDGRLSYVLGDAQSGEELASLGMLQRDVHDALVVGALGGLLPPLLQYPLLRVDVVEPDARLARLAVDHADPATRTALRDSRVHLIIGDPRRVLRDGGRWDAILLALPEPSTIALNRYYSREFFALARARLSPGGVLAFRLPGAEDFYGEELLARNGSVYKALVESFPNVAVTPLATNYFLASDAPLTLDWQELGHRLVQRKLHLQYLIDEYAFLALLPPDRVGELPAQFASTPAPENHDLAPTAFQHDLVLARQQEEEGAKSSLGTLTTCNPWLAEGGLLLLLGLCVVLPAVPWRHGAYQRWTRLFLVAAMGAAGMAMNLLLLLLAQVSMGALYHLLGALLALWMAGMALGAWQAEGVIGRRAYLPLVAGLGLLGALALFAPTAAALPVAVTFLVLACLAVLSGAAVGVVFPLMVQQEHSPGAIYAADLLGAAPAAVITTVFLLPSYGLAWTCGLIAVPLLLALLANLHWKALKA